jgi:hypothetical protein
MKVYDGPKGPLGGLLVECADGNVYEVDTRDEVEALATIALHRFEELERKRWREQYRPLYTSNDLADLVQRAQDAKERARAARAPRLFKDGAP